MTFEFGDRGWAWPWEEESPAKLHPAPGTLFAIASICRRNLEEC